MQLRTMCELFRDHEPVMELVSTSAFDFVFSLRDMSGKKLGKIIAESVEVMCMPTSDFSFGSISFYQGEDAREECLWIYDYLDDHQIIALLRPSNRESADTTGLPFVERRRLAYIIAHGFRYEEP